VFGLKLSNRLDLVVRGWAFDLGVISDQIALEWVSVQASEQVGVIGSGGRISYAA
jgi:hypothetical protein